MRDRKCYDIGLSIAENKNTFLSLNSLDYTICTDHAFCYAKMCCHILYALFNKQYLFEVVINMIKYDFTPYTISSLG